MNAEVVKFDIHVKTVYTFEDKLYVFVNIIIIIIIIIIC